MVLERRVETLFFLSEVASQFGPLAGVKIGQGNLLLDTWAAALVE